MTTFVVSGNGDVDEFGRGVCITEGDNGDIDVGSLLDSLSVGAGISDDDETGFFEGPGDIIGEVSGGKSSGDGDCTGVGSKLEDGALAVGTSGDDGDISWIVDCCDDAGSQDDFCPG